MWETLEKVGRKERKRTEKKNSFVIHKAIVSPRNIPVEHLVKKNLIWFSLTAIITLSFYQLHNTYHVEIYVFSYLFISVL